jgi:molecular chaperone DnaK
MSGDNKALGRFILDGILPAPRGIPQVEVTFDIDANGIVNVSARDKGTGREQKITIQSSSGLSKEEIEKMQREAEMFADEDRKKRDSIELKNTADSMAYQAEKTLRDNPDKIPADLKADVEAKIADVKSAIEADDSDRMQSAIDALSMSLQKIGEAVYGAAGAEGAPSPDGFAEGEPGEAPGGAQEGTVEGEFREV